MKKFLSLLFIVIFLLSSCVACQSQETEIPENPVVSSPSSSSPQPSSCPPALKDRLPTGEALEALGVAGKTVKLLGWEEQKSHTFPSEEGEKYSLQDRLFYHWLSVTERFSISMEADYASTAEGAQNHFLTILRSEGATYDLIQTSPATAMTLALEGSLCNLRKLDFPDREMRWWPAELEEWTQHSGQYFITSNSSAQVIHHMSVVFVNEAEITEKIGINPPEFAIHGHWTIEEMTSIAKQFAGEADNTLGLIIDDPTLIDTLYYACGFRSVTKNKDEFGVLAFNGQKTLEHIEAAVSQLKELLTGSGTAIYASGDASATNAKAVMLLGTIGQLAENKISEQYVPVPLPMLDDTQYNEEHPGLGYRTVLQEQYDVWCIPTTTQNKILSGMVIEASASDEYRNIGPYYFEQFLKDIYATPPNARKCFDIFRGSIVFDFGKVGDNDGFGVHGFWRACFWSNDGKQYANVFEQEYQNSVANGNDPAKKLNDLIQAFQQYVNQ